MTNAFGVVLDSAGMRRAAAEEAPETVIAAIYLLHERSVDEIVAKLRPSELEQVIKLVGRCPSCYPPGTLAALKDRRRPPSPKPQPGERINPDPERLHRADERTSRSTEGTRRWTPPSRFAGFGSKVLQSATERAATNPYGITLSRVWTDWAAQHGVSETIAAALCLISRNRKVGEVVVKLTPGEMERVVAFVQGWPDRFPPGTLAALKNSRPTSSLEQSAACGSPGAALTRGNVCPTRAYGPAGFRTEVQQRATEHATPTNAEKPGTLPGTLAESTRRRMVVEDLMGAGLSVRTISAGTGIPRSSVHRAMRAIARAEAKKVVAIAEIAKALLGKKLRSRAKGI
jgi:hypothetical protein